MKIVISFVWLTLKNKTIGFPIFLSLKPDGVNSLSALKLGQFYLVEFRFWIVNVVKCKI